MHEAWRFKGRKLDTRVYFMKRLSYTDTWKKQSENRCLIAQEGDLLLMGKYLVFYLQNEVIYLGLHWASLNVKAVWTRRSTLTDGRTLLSLWLIPSSNGSAPVLLWRPFCLNTMWTSFIRPNFVVRPPQPGDLHHSEHHFFGISAAFKSILTWTNERERCTIQKKKKRMSTKKEKALS